MTIRLLCAYSIYPTNAIVTLDAATEAGLVAARQASTNTTGGVPYVPPAQSNQVFPARLVFDGNKNVLGLENPEAPGSTIGLGGSSAPTVLTGAVTGTGIGTVDTTLAPSVLDAAVLALGFQHGSVGETYVVLPELYVTTTGGLGTAPSTGLAIAAPATTCNACFVENDSMFWIGVQRNGAGAFFLLPPLSRTPFVGIANTSDLSFRLRDYATARASQQVTLTIQPITLSGMAAPYVVSHYADTPSTNNGYNNMAYFPCSAVEVFNTGPCDMFGRIWSMSQQFGSITGTHLVVTDARNSRPAIGQTSTNGPAAGTKIVGFADSSGNPTTVDNGVDYIVSISQTYGPNGYMQFENSVAHRIARNSSRLYTGLTNQDYLGFSTLTGALGSYCALRYSGPVPKLRAESLLIDKNEVSPDARLYQRDTMFGDQTVFTTMGDAIPKTDYKRKGVRLALFRDVATTTVSGPATAANAALGGDNVSMVNLTANCLEITSTGTSLISLTPQIFANMPVDMTKCDPHMRIALMSGSVSSLFLDVYSGNDPTNPGTDFHRYDWTSKGLGQFNGAFSIPNGYAARSVGGSTAVAQGAGADLTNIKFAIIRYVSTTGTVVRPEYVDAVKRGSAKASLIFTVDDLHPGAMTNLMPILASAGMVGVLYPSPASKMIPGENSSSTGLDNLLSLQSMGWQIASQDFNDEGSVDHDDAAWLLLQKKNLMSGIALGFDPEGLRDGSLYGGGTYFGNAHYKQFRKVMASCRKYDVLGNNNYGGTFTGYIVGNTLTLSTASVGTGIVTGSIIVGFSSTGITDDLKVVALASGTANAAGATYTLSGTAQTVGSAGAPIALAAENQQVYICDTNPPGDPWDMQALGWDASFPVTSVLNVYAKLRMYLDQAIAIQGTAVVSSHNAYDGASSTVQNQAMLEFAKYAARKIKAGVVENVTFAEQRKKQAALA